MVERRAKMEATLGRKEFLIDFAARYVKLISGLFCIALGIVTLLYSDLGLNPWNVFQQGVSLHSPLTLGQASQVVGFVIIVGSMFFKIYPGVGTVTNMIIVGLFVDMLDFSGLFITPGPFVLKLLMCCFGVVVTGFGTYVYISQGIGAGPRDSLMMIITQKTRFNIGVVRNSIEVTVLIIGYFLGGKVGVGTVIVSLGTGPCINFFFKLFKGDPKTQKQDNIVVTFKKFRDALRGMEVRQG